MTSKNVNHDIIPAIIQVLKEGKKETLHELIKDLKPFDLATQFKNLPVKHHPLFLECITMDELTSLLPHLTREEQLQALRTVGPNRSTTILEMLENNDLSFLLSSLPQKEVNSLISEMKQEEMDIIRQTMNYPPKTAGRVMTRRYVWIHSTYTVEQAVNKLKGFLTFATYLNYLYVIDNDKKLVGAVSYRDLLLAEPDAAIEDIMAKNIVKVDVLTKQKKVAQVIGHYDYDSVPVVDEQDILLGIITVDDVLDIVVREANDDIEMLLASGKSIDFRTKPTTAAYRRLPWLLLLLFIGLISGSIISRFEETLEAVVALAFFMPMIAGMTGNTGTQSLAVIVRGVDSEDLTLKKMMKLIFRELLVGILIGITCAIVISIIAYIWQGSLVLGLVVGSSLLVTLIIGTLAGTIIPLILHKFNVDPAVASGPLITTINDILSLLIYFGIATMFISKLS